MADKYAARGLISIENLSIENYSRFISLGNWITVLLSRGNWSSLRDFQLIDKDFIFILPDFFQWSGGFMQFPMTIENSWVDFGGKYNCGRRTWNNWKTITVHRSNEQLREISIGFTQVTGTMNGYRQNEYRRALQIRIFAYAQLYRTNISRTFGSQRYPISRRICIWVPPLFRFMAMWRKVVWIIDCFL